MEKNSSEYKKIGFEAFGVATRIEINNPQFLEKLLEGLRIALPGGLKLLEPSENSPCQYRFEFDGPDRLTYLMDGQIYAELDSPENYLNYFLSRIRLRIAERAVGRVFIHAGAVVWKERAIILPGNSFQGKTTLVAALVRSGAEYLSDEYAVLDGSGAVEPFPKPLSMRRPDSSDYAQTEIPAGNFGRTAEKSAYPVGTILFLEYRKGAGWDPQVLSPGQGMLEILSHTIPIRYNPRFSLGVLNKTLNRAIIAKCQRGEADGFAEMVLDYSEEHHFKLDIPHS